ncbi:UDP-N-acetylmuramoyl-L-alanine--D-glutamate ligase [Ornithinimicrobium cryptoxanthini]|uniref:UDP-N-acetylmuramoylalanine--D-glutamate ligase n=1 Tax=Ornithinimicrobium cryptoxanthini TaxID=2934161 RepID=A0ABY4YKY1_9MICO|nr:UDP-N-acetylmuramoyl-L-alanine--D-glutamate ligase [Ornithinimicrobium cryptoxanthini]USQ77456.1 UDP-N-acetylmuramoyl-L-alanine--D-glutamate ligase [Ornithinimicrobium cryptoxanthini]
MTVNDAGRSSDLGQGRLAGLTHRDADWAGLRVVVTGLGISGFAATDALLERGAQVIVVDGGTGASAQDERARLLEILGADVRLGPEHTTDLPWFADEGTTISPDLVVTSPGWRPDQPVLAAAARAGIPIWGEVELAWRMRPATGAAPWLTVTGTNGKTTTVQMLESILRAAGLRTIAAGNVGTPVLEALLDPQPFDVIAVELSSFQLHWSESVSALASCVLNVAPDHLDWHGGQEAYAAAKAKIFEHTQVACVYNHDDPATEAMVEEADVIEGCRAIGFTLGTPALSMLGVVDDVLADRAFVTERKTSAAELATLRDLTGSDLTGGDPDRAPAPHLVADALAAAALARAFGVPPAAVQQGLRDFTPAEHRITEVAQIDGVRYVDDSKATNPHAAQASLAAYEHIVWIAGGQLKGADVDALVAGAAGRLRAAVLLGQDRAQIAAALARHAPQIPVVEVPTGETVDVTAVMDEAVEAARGLAQPGDVVLLAPAAASLDMFANYGVRGDAFTDAVRRRAGGESS